MPRLKLVQLPVPPPASLVSTGNVPLAAGCLAVAARVHQLELAVEALDPAITDGIGDTALADLVADGEPEFVGLSLYLWNSERSLHLAREIKRRSPRTIVLIGGPEVGPDNPFVFAQEGFDVAVTGEAEPAFAAVMERLISHGVAGVEGFPGVAVRTDAGLGAFAPARPADFPLTDYPSPYLDGTVPVDGARSTYLESVRGCRSACTYCFYPRSSGVLRTLDVDATAALVAAVRDCGARQVTFLDPTFNHRPGFEQSVAALGEVNRDRQLSFFAEVRSEGLTAKHCAALAKAGFDKLEIGLQSVNRETLKRVKRFGDPDKVALAARMLQDEGVELLVDSIVGLPGDGPADVLAGVDFLHDHGLAASAQVFLLSVLPGTAMRTDAAAFGLDFEPTPPYRIKSTGTMDPDTLAATLFEAEERLDRRLDEYPRPHLVDPAADAVWFDVDRPTPTLPGARHQSLWLVGKDLDSRAGAAFEAVDARLKLDPHCTLDVVVAPDKAPSTAFLGALRAKLSAAPASYATRLLAHRGEDLHRRITAVQRQGVAWTPAELARVEAAVPLFVECSAEDAASRAARLGDEDPAARVIGKVEAREFDQLKAGCEVESVAFADRATEARWQAEVLGYE